MAPKNNITVGIIAVCVLAAASFVSYQFGYGRGVGTAATEVQNTSSAGQRMAMGTVESVSGQGITLKDFRKISPSLSASSANLSARLTVTVDQATSIQRLVPKDADTIKKEQAAFAKEAQAQSSQSLTPPEPFTRETIALKDVKAGDIVLAYASEDIAKLDAFTAVKIEVQSILPMSANPPASKPQ